MNKIYAVIGMCGSGKSEAVKIFLSHGYKRVYFGDVVMNELKKNSLEVNEQNERLMRERLRSDFGMGAMAVKSLDKIINLYKTDNVVIESLYSWDEYKIIDKEFPNIFKLVTTFTSKEIRYQRLSVREGRPLTKSEAISRDMSEIENLDKGGPIAFTDYLIINDGTLEELRNNVNKIL